MRRRRLRVLLAELMVGYHQGRQESHRRAVLKWNDRLPARPVVTIHFPKVDKVGGSASTDG